MKHCLACDTSYVSVLWDCPQCRVIPAMINGFMSHAPEFAFDGDGGFKPHQFAELIQLEAGNFWFRARNQIILWGLRKYCSNFESFLEIGCGTGFVLSGISGNFQFSKLVGSEIFIAGLGCAADRLPSVDLMQMDARQIPFVDEFDVIGAFDVLEHIREDTLVLSQVYKALKNQGLLFLTVPQHAWLWSNVDESACHIRRYSSKDIHTKLRAAGFSVLRSTSFVSFLLPAMLLSRITKKKGKINPDQASELKLSSILNRLFYSIMLTELGLIKRGLNFPFGGSRFIIARKII